MSRPSSADLALRFLVMVGVLGAGAWAAAVYTPVVDIALRQWNTWQHPPQPPPGDLGGDAPLFQPGDAGRSELETAAGAPPGMLPSATAAEPIRVADAAAQSDPMASMRPVDAALAPPYPAQQAAFQRSDQIGAVPAAPAPTGPVPLGAAPLGAVAAASLTAGGSDSLGELDAQLGRLGAVYTLLERWGQDPARFRFHCKVALVAGSQETRSFEAIGEDPLRLMRQVVEEITTWRASRSP